MTMAIESQEAPAAVIDLRGMFSALARRKKLIFGITAACILLSLAVVLVMRPRFVSSVELLIDPRGQQVLPNDVSPNTASAEAMFAMLESQARVLTSGEVLRSVIAKLHLDEDPEFTSGGVETDDAASVADARTRAALRTLLKRITVRRLDRTYVINLSLWTSSPEKSRQIVSAIVQSYFDVQAQTQTETAKRTAAALEGRLDALRLNLASAEKQLETYRIQHNLVGGKGRLLSEREITDLVNQASAQRIRTIELQSRMEVLRQHKGNSQKVIGTIAEAVQSQTLNDLLARYAEVKKAEADNLASLGPLHPAVITAHAQVRQVSDLIEAELRRIQQSLVTEYQRSKDVEAELNRQIIAAREVASSGQPAIAKLRQLEDDVAAQRQVYETIQRRAKEVSDAGSVDRTIVRVISPPTEQPATYLVPRSIVLAGGPLLGLLAGLFAAAFLNQFDRKVQGSPDLVRDTGVFNLAVVPEQVVRTGSQLDSASGTVELECLTDTFDVLKAALSRFPGAILVLGADRPEASGTFTLALAKLASQQGIRALTVDATRTRYITKLSNLDSKPGFSEARQGLLPLSMFEVQVGGLNILPAGTQESSRPASSVKSQIDDSFFNTNSEMTFIDGGLVQDRDFLATIGMASIVLIVVDVGKSRGDRLAEALQIIKSYRSRLVATIMQT